MGRTRAKRLRGFGNAIVLPLATAFVESVIEAFADTARSLGLHTIEVVPDSVPDPVIATVHDPVIALERADVTAEEDAA